MKRRPKFECRRISKAEAEKMRPLPVDLPHLEVALRKWMKLTLHAIGKCALLVDAESIDNNVASEIGMTILAEFAAEKYIAVARKRLDLSRLSPLGHRILRYIDGHADRHDAATKVDLSRINAGAAEAEAIEKELEAEAEEN